MDDYDGTITFPAWNAKMDKIKKVVVEEDVTTIGDYAFIGATNLKEVTLPSDFYWRECV
jgi:hypothetical protein